MIPTVLIDLPASLALGHLFAVIGSRALEQYYKKFADTYMKPLSFAMLYMIGCYVPITGYFYFAYPAWSLNYLWDPERIPWFLGLIVVPGYAMMAFIGWVSAAFWIVRKKSWVACLQLFWALSLVAVVCWLTSDAFLHIGDYAQFQLGEAPLLWKERGFFVMMMVMGGLLTAGALVAGYAIWREGRRYHASIRLGSS
ncbi:MAG: hypothetical protein HY391_03155 [Deltaproteobacteria bacterium]|nr:hypothetical protein [Deltaproteobacteria bacterium]